MNQTTNMKDKVELSLIEIERAIGCCDDFIAEHRAANKRLVWYYLACQGALITAIFLIAFGLYLILKVVSPVVASALTISDLTSQLDKIIYVTVFLMVVITGVFVSFYRLHLKEVVRNELLLVDFIRLRIVILKTDDDYQPLNEAMLLGLFSSNLPESTKRTVENPLPGSIVTDLATKISNKVIGAISATK